MAKKAPDPSSGRLPVQAWDEINVTHERVKTTQKVEMVPSKEMKQFMRAMKAQKGRKHGR